MTDDELKIASLRERLTIIVSRYEDEITSYRVDATKKTLELQAEIDRLKKEYDVSPEA